MTGVVQIPDPCHESWEKMHPQANGRFCDSCCKVVVDFTNFSNQEIADYLKAKSNERICGRFKATQVHKTPETKTIQLNNNRRLWKLQQFAAALLLAFGSVLFTSCEEEHKVGELEKTPGDQIYADTVKADTTTHLRTKAPECETVTVESEIQGMLMGAPLDYPEQEYTIGAVIEQPVIFVEEVQQDSTVAEIKKDNIFSRISDRLKLKR
jgi:hypothetical protein